MIKENPSNEIIKTVYNLDPNTEVNLNSISLLESSKSSSDISKSKVPIENYNKIIEEDYLDLTEVPPTLDLSEA